MTKYTDNLTTPYPEAIPDLADVPKNMRDMAVSWENAFGAVWSPWNIVAVQGTTAVGAPVPIGLDAASVARVLKTGKTVYASAGLIVATGTGLTGYVMFSLPYPMADSDEPVGVIQTKYSASTRNISAAITPTVGQLLGSAGWVYEHVDTPTTRVAADWMGLLLRYETV